MIRSFVIFFSLLLLLVSPTLSFSKMMSVNGENVRLRSGPGENFSVKWEYGTGFPLKIITYKNGWYKVSDFENDTGWIYKDLLSPQPYMIVKVNKNKGRKINIRSGPGRHFKIVGKAYYGVVFKTITQKDGWAQVRHESGLVGWVKRTLLWGF